MKEFLPAKFNLDNFSVIGIGPGLGMSRETVNAFGNVLAGFSEANGY